MLNFDEQKHEYTLDGKKLISVTQLMQKYGLAPTYEGVSPTLLQAKAEYGSFIHKEIEEWIKERKIGFSRELVNFVEYNKSTDTNVVQSEYKVYNDIVAGTIDLLLVRNEKPIIADIKTTYQIHKEAVSWQLSIYLYLYIKMSGFTDGEYQVTYNDFTGECYHFNKDGDLKVVKIPLKPIEDVENLMEAERNGVQYAIVLDKLSYQELEELAEIETLIKFYEDERKKAEQRETLLRESLMKAMQENGISEYETDKLKITLIAESTRTTLDSKAIKENYPEIYEKHQKTSTIKPTIRITLRGKKDE